MARQNCCATIRYMLKGKKNTRQDRLKEHLEEGVGLWSGLEGDSLPSSIQQMAGTVLGLCHLMAFRLRTGSTPPVIGILGSASSGKSTLFNSLARASIAKVTPIPHQTTGPILAMPKGLKEDAGDPSFFRPIVDEVEWAAPGTTDLTGTPEKAMLVPVWDDGDSAIILIDLPDIGTVDSRHERLIAMRTLPWLDRVILVVTEESFAQAEHEEIDRWLKSLHPERARPELFVVLNRRHHKTTDAEFESRLAKVKSLWQDATVSILPHLEDNGFSSSRTGPLVAEAHARVSLMLVKAVRNLSEALDREVAELADTRIRERRSLEAMIRRDLKSACRLRKAFFSPDFSKRLDAFSPWRKSLGHLRALVKKEELSGPVMVDLLAQEPVERHVNRAIEEMQWRVAKYVERVTGTSREELMPALASMDKPALQESISNLVAETNEKARCDVQTLLESLQEERKIKDPLLGMVTAAASTLFLLDLVIPSVGTIGTLTASAALSALGLGGMITSDVLRKLRTSRLKEFFEEGLESILKEAESSLLNIDRLARLDLTEHSRDIARWTRELPEA
ncbi:GTPase [Acidobacteriota bacterium]